MRVAFRRVALLMLGGCLIGASARSSPLDVVEPMPVHSMAPAWFEALQASGARVADDFEAQVTTVHPLQTGQWSRPIMASVDGPGGTVTLVGTVVFEAVGPAESRVRVESAADASSVELLAWRLVSRKATRRARESLSGKATTPDAVRADVARTLADPLACVSQVAALQRIGSDLVVEFLVASRETIASTCVPMALSVVARNADDSNVWSQWFRRAWNQASPVERASLSNLLVAIESVPPDLAALRQGLRLEQEIASDAADAAARRQAEMPVMCADGSVDPTCRCSDPPQTCCVHHGGIEQCLPPPPE